MLGRAAFLAPTVHLGCAALAFIVSWFIWRETGLPCTIQTAMILLCNPDSALSGWIRLDAIQQCAIIAGISLAITGGNDGMFFLQERRARKQAEAYASQVKMRADQAETLVEQERTRADHAESELHQAAVARQKEIGEQKAAQKAEIARIREWLESLSTEQKDAIYPGPFPFGNTLWVRIDGKDAVGPRDDTNWLVDTFAPAPAE